MDPITAISLLAALSELIKTSNGALAMISRFRDGESELKDITNDVTVFAECLKGCDRVLRSRQAKHSISPEIIRGVIDEGLATIQDLEKHLAQITGTESSTMRKFKWMQNRSYFKKLHERFKDQILMAQSFVSLAHTWVLQACDNPNFRH
jgi:hypothetical protein